MKARVKATGLIINAVPFNVTYENGRCIRGYIDINTDIQYAENEIDFINTEIQDEPDYWEKLKHQYAGMFLAGMLANSEWEGTSERLSEIAIEIAEIHIKRLKEEEK